jgi:transposase-like protein
MERKCEDKTPNSSDANQFKALVALEALKGVKSIQEIAVEFGVHPVQVLEWKMVMAQNAARAFGAGPGSGDAEEMENERARLHAQIEQQAVELEWLTKKSKQLGL